MREELKGALLWLALVFLAGMVIGRLVVPRFQWHITRYVGIDSDPNTKTCTIDINETTAPWKETYATRSLTLKCRELKIFGDMKVHCWCKGD